MVKNKKNNQTKKCQQKQPNLFNGGDYSLRMKRWIWICKGAKEVAKWRLLQRQRLQQLSDGGCSGPPELGASRPLRPGVVQQRPWRAWTLLLTNRDTWCACNYSNTRLLVEKTIFFHCKHST